MSRLSDLSQQEQLAWIASIVNREMNNKTHGSVTIRMEEGRAVQVKYERSEMPPKKRGA